MKEIVESINEDIFQRNQELKDCNRRVLEKCDQGTLEEVKSYIELIYCNEETLMGFAERKIDSKRLREKSLEEVV